MALQLLGGLKWTEVFHLKVVSFLGGISGISVLRLLGICGGVGLSRLRGRKEERASTLPLLGGVHILLLLGCHQMIGWGIKPFVQLVRLCPDKVSVCKLAQLFLHKPYANKGHFTGPLSGQPIRMAKGP